MKTVAHKTNVILEAQHLNNYLDVADSISNSRNV